ncbi:MAG: restriction endonuclease [Acidobacteria bacterium]|nr:restriction endonuclease [Acidobacteriota bacterium]
MTNIGDKARPPNDAIEVQDLSRFYEAIREFASEFSRQTHNQLRGVDNGKTLGTYIEHKLRDFLATRGIIRSEDFGSSAKGIDLPTLNIDIKVTSIRQPQSSSPFTSFKQKIEGLGYNLILFVYEKTDTDKECYLPLRIIRYIPKERTADFQTTAGILKIIAHEGNEEDIYAFLVERMIPVDEITLMQYAKWLVKNPPLQGYLTISNALQWRLQYQRVISEKYESVVGLDPENLPELPATAKVSETIVDPLIDEE